jgi:hypothetical protein
MGKPEMDDLERELHLGLGKWALHHADRYAEVGLLPFDPARYPEQRITTGVTLANPVHGDRLGGLEALYLRNGGPTAAATLAAFRCAGGESGGISVAEEIRKLVEAGQSVAILTSHAERLDDVAAFAGSVALAMGRPALVSRNGAILNKVMSRETHQGQPIVRLISPFANSYWVIPDTESARRWMIPEAAVRYVNGRGLRALLGAIRAGAAVTLAPAGSAMLQHRDAANVLKKLTFPPVSRATANLLTRFDAFVLAARWGERVSVTPVMRIKHISRNTRDGGSVAVARKVMSLLGDRTAEVAEVPVATPTFSEA